MHSFGSVMSGFSRTVAICVLLALAVVTLYSQSSDPAALYQQALRRETLLRQELDAAQPGHLQIGQDQIDPSGLQPLERGLAVGGGHHAVAVAVERPLQALAQPGVVVGDQDGGGVRHGPAS